MNKYDYSWMNMYNIPQKSNKYKCMLSSMCSKQVKTLCIAPAIHNTATRMMCDADVLHCMSIYLVTL